ncbi:hypothetical protein NUW58_g9597 [Xylaria curta]|uniref:Uncharacterized protein n=1 Tax=Xylaria curta TaxID=42375 RepID=A0ACC1MWZ5_9PEZI|nr:hypothetical protein NUW58_g9597 [Xylaria curta]
MSICLLQQNRVYRDTIRSLDAVLKNLPQSCDWSLEEQIMAGEGESRIREAAVSQPLCTAVQIALVDFLRSVGIAFHTVVGHSSGEIAAAYAAGKISAQDAIAISYYRGMAAHLAGGSNGQKGGMLAANMSETEAFGFCSDPLFVGRIGIAASNSPTSVTLSGDIDAIVLAAKRLADQQKSPKLLPLDTAYHSWHMKKPAVEYIDRMREYGVSPMPDGNGSIWISSVKGHPRTGAQGLDCQYWVDNMVNQVQFREAVEYALSQSDVKFDCAIEIGPRLALRGPFARTAAALDLDRVIPYTCPLSDKKASGLSVPEFLGFMWSWFGTSGVNLRSYIEQSPMPNLVRSRLFNLPSYPFDHSVDYWRESRISRQYRSRAEAPHELLGVRCREDNEHEMKWRNILKHSQLPWLKGHQFQGQTLLPASAYCVMALGAARCVIADRHASLVQLENVEILSGIAINNDNDDPGVETVFRLEILPSDRNSSTIQATFDLCSCPANTDANSSNTMKKHANGSMRIVLGEPSMGVLPPPEPSLSETLGASPEAFYQMMTASGLGYTGPFKALKSIQRRYQHCHATLSRVHADDTTTLRPSPATLDACFQSTFLAYSAPSDGALWTSFLPARIGAVRFNLAALEGKAMTDRADTLIVDTHMVYCKSPEEARKASIAFDITISNEAKEAEIQIEELVIHAVANTSPSDDKELYLHTVMDVDPTDEIVCPSDDALDTDESPLAEKCRRIASFYLDNHIVPDMHKLNIHLSYGVTKSSFNTANEGVRSETQESIDDMIRNSKHAEYLESIATIGKQDPTRLSQGLPFILREAHGVSIFRNHVGRIVKQITHRYPWMNILHLATAQTEFTHPILAAIGDSFQSLTISVSQETSTRSFEGVRKLNIDLHEKLAAQLGSDALLDLAILPTTLLVRDDAKRVLKNIGEVLKAGGFLVLIDPRTAVLDAQLKTFRTHHPTLQYWQELLTYCGFVRHARNSDQYLSAGSVLVRQFREATHPSIPSHIRCNGNGAGIGTPLLVCGTSGKGDSQLVTLLQDQLSFHYGDTI